MQYLPQRKIDLTVTTHFSHSQYTIIYSVSVGKQGKPGSPPTPRTQAAPAPLTATFGPFSQGARGLVQRTPLIRHSAPPAQPQAVLTRTSANSENQAFLNDVSLYLFLYETSTPPLCLLGVDFRKILTYLSLAYPTVIHTDNKSYISHHRQL